MNINYNQLKFLIDNPETVLRMALFDAAKHSNEDAFLKWESKEPGSIIGMINAYKTMLDSIEQDLTLDIINEIHASLISIKKYGNYKFLTLNNNKVHIETKLKFELIATTEPNQVLLDRLNSDAALLQNKFNFTHLPYKAELSTNAYNNVVPHIFDALSCGANPTDYTNAIIEDYNDINNKNLSHDQILEKIIILARDLERVHIYSDFNCRTFCVILLNREFIRNNLPVVMLEDFNIFDSFKIEDIKKEIYKGRERAAKLFDVSSLKENQESNKHWRNYIVTEINYHNQFLSLLNKIIESIATKDFTKDKLIEYLQESLDFSKQIKQKNNKIHELFLKDLLIESPKIQFNELHMSCLNYEYEISEMIDMCKKALKQFDIATNYKHMI